MFLETVIDDSISPGHEAESHGYTTAAIAIASAPVYGTSWWLEYLPIKTLNSERRWRWWAWNALKALEFAAALGNYCVRRILLSHVNVYQGCSEGITSTQAI